VNVSKHYYRGKKLGTLPHFQNINEEGRIREIQRTTHEKNLKKSCWKWGGEWGEVGEGEIDDEEKRRRRSRSSFKKSSKN
jgi:hypothetical protein